MICASAEEFAATLPSFGAICGLDLGTVTIGVAVSDSMRSVATPLETIKRKKFTLDAARLLEIAKARDLKGIVLGLPMNMDGSEGPQTQLILKFADQLQALLSIPVYLQDERLSSFSAEEKLAPANLTKGKMKERLDAVAAAEILEAFLEQKH